MPRRRRPAASPMGISLKRASSDYLYVSDKYVEGGWFVEESDRWSIRVTLRRRLSRLMTVLRDLKEQRVAKSFTGLVSQVSFPDRRGRRPSDDATTNIDAAWHGRRISTPHGRHRRSAAVRDAALNAAEGMDVLVDVFFAEFVERNLIRD